MGKGQGEFSIPIILGLFGLVLILASGDSTAQKIGLALFIIALLTSIGVLR